MLLLCCTLLLRPFVPITVIEIVLLLSDLIRLLLPCQAGVAVCSL